MYEYKYYHSNSWTASTSQEVSISTWSPIAVKTLHKVQMRFEELLHAIAQLVEQFSYRILNINRE